MKLGCCYYPEHWPEAHAEYETLAEKGQTPHTLIVACSDSRADPALIFDAKPGELFVVRNVANLVPPYEPDGHLHGVSAALEFGVKVLGVSRIMVMGHAHCGGVNAMRYGAPDYCQDFVAPWVAQGSPQDLLNASIYFDFRPLCGDVALAQALRADVTLAARNSPRFLKMLAHNALGRSVPLNWRGAIDTDEHGALDLKLQGTALFVDAARIYSLALGVHETNTRLRLEAAGAQWRLPETETGAWVGGFEFLQILRLRVQLEAGEAEAAPPNRIVVAGLNDIDRRILRESFRVARQLQQRLQLDYDR